MVNRISAQQAHSISSRLLRLWELAEEYSKSTVQLPRKIPLLQQAEFGKLLPENSHIVCSKPIFQQRRINAPKINAEL